MAKYPARGNVPAGKVQRKFYLSEALADILRIEAAKRNESQSEIVERALRKELGMVRKTVWPLISLVNPWSKALVHINRSEVTAERLEAMAQLMEDDIREELHSECPDDPAEFFARYVERVGPERAGEVWFA